MARSTGPGSSEMMFPHICQHPRTCQLLSANISVDVNFCHSSSNIQVRLTSWGKVGSLIRKHDNFTPARKMRRNVRGLTALDHPEG